MEGGPSEAQSSLPSFCGADSCEAHSPKAGVLALKQLSFPKHKIRVLLLEGVSAAGVRLLQEDSLDVEVAHASLSEAELSERVAGLHVLGIRSKTRVTRRVLERADRLLAIGCFCIGTDQVDLGAAAERGVPVFNAPFANSRSVAELVIGSIVGLARRVGDCTQLMHRGDWLKQTGGCCEVRGKCLGVVGYGHIGSQVSVLAEALSMRVVFYDVVPKLPMGGALQLRTLPELLRAADFVSLHVPSLPCTKLMIGAAEIALMRPGSFLLNASRGGVVDIPALAAALRSEHLAGAAVDVFPHEPSANGPGLFESELRGCPNTLLTPHIGGSTVEAQDGIGLEVAAALLKVVNSGCTTQAVNFPAVEIPQMPGSHRILCLHRNVPGAMSKINGVFARAGANIRQQALSTLEDIGYVIIDLNVEASREVRERLRELDITLKVRVLY